MCPRSNIEILSKVFPDFYVSTKNSKYLDFFRTGLNQIAMIRNTSFYTISKTQGLNCMDMENTGFPILAEKGWKRILNLK